MTPLNPETQDRIVAISVAVIWVIIIVGGIMIAEIIY